mmetsp:Transcript_70187/g.142029  ORF Transcript_70187/g.142029 Transcript_70187/m.142029 type:complete len:236 (-) Transcript_70187:447-1154(-)
MRHSPCHRAEDTARPPKIPRADRSAPGSARAAPRVHSHLPRRACRPTLSWCAPRVASAKGAPSATKASQRPGIPRKPTPPPHSRQPRRPHLGCTLPPLPSAPDASAAVGSSSSFAAVKTPPPLSWHSAYPRRQPRKPLPRRRSHKPSRCSAAAVELAAIDLGRGSSTQRYARVHRFRGLRWHKSLPHRPRQNKPPAVDAWSASQALATTTRRAVHQDGQCRGSAGADWKCCQPHL